MFVLNLFFKVLMVFLLAAPFTFAETKPIVAHNDPIETDNSLTLSHIVDLTMEKFPDMAWLKSLEEEALTIRQRGEKWTYGPMAAGLRYQEVTSGTVHYVDAFVAVPLWNLGQREAEQKYGIKSENSAELLTAATKLRVAGLVRGALWDMELQQVRYQQARAEIDIFEKLLAKVERRVELGDLPRSDVLLAQTELLQKLSVLTQVEAELMHARKRYSSITQQNKIPGSYREQLAPIKRIEFNHPSFVAMNSQIERKQAEIDAFNLQHSGQTQVVVGVNSDRPSNNDPRSNNTESFNIGVNVPFGGNAYYAPHVAALNVELNNLIARREQLYRDLELAHHEAEHNMEVNEAELEIAKELKRVAEDHLGMMELSFSVGEINLMDLLKVQSRAQQAILNAKERAIMLDRDIALYNQAVGVLP
jgi:cobalt-zinc-cadmium efflux system outer membrane protein